ncbi:hypothetical protein OZ411_28780 [Bradyrhizobium sp. Arg237L]|uniref:hypothetical protein n=1 Tax=Bradyrhizobium sp. Arg237L TaxID=3003352 RepID=UPI00249EBE4B|nr:hypothetical protein [Bradyrhizobium sp. Arg237L]MDI4236813.1 hypothetical protein [Bradyrhizobium sp. Arg237L]
MGDSVDQTFSLALNLSGTAFEFRAVSGRAAREQTAFIVVDLQIVLPISGVLQHFPQSVEHSGFNLVAVDHAAVRTRTALAVCRALNARLATVQAYRAHPSTAHGATEQSTQQARHAVHCRFDDGPTLCAHSRPRVIADDTKMGSGNPLVLRRWIGTRQSFARGRVFDHADFVPDDLPDVDFVLQYAVAPLCAALDR